MRNKPKGMQFFFLIKLNGGGGGRGVENSTPNSNRYAHR